MNLVELRKTMPSLNGLSDQDAVDVIHQAYYPTRDRNDISKALGIAPPPPPPPPSAGVLRTAGDVGIKLAQGTVDLGSSVVGLASLATGGLAGKGMRAIGYDPKKTNEVLGEYLSDSQKAAEQQVAQADGFFDSIGAAVQNPRAILGSIAQSAPGMIGGMGVQSAVARRIAAKAALATGEGAAASAAQLAAGKSAAEASKAALATTAGKNAAAAALDSAGTKLVALGAATEGAQTAGQIADSAQGAGRDYADYALPALAAGAGTAGISLGAGKLLGDASTQIATGARSTGVKGGLAARAGKEFISEGVLEEAPQSAQEQYFTNVAMGEDDRMKGVANAAGTGLVTGGVMGVGLGAMQHNNNAPAPLELPNTGPLSQAANAGQAAVAAKANATAPQGTTTPAGPTLEQIDARMAELVAIGRGQLAGKAVDAAGNAVAVPAVAGRPLNAQEQSEYESLKQARAAATAIPPAQKAEYEALLAQEAAQQNAKYAATMQAAAQARDAEETRQIAAMVAEDERRKREAEEEIERQNMAAVNALVQQGDAARAAANRAALRDSVINDATIPHAEKKAAFRRALAADGYLDTQLDGEDRAIFAQAANPTPAPAPELLPSAPNELTDAVPERQTSAPASGAVNTRAVDDAIAAGMRLKTLNGKVLHKPGSAKVFTLSAAQKAYYLQAIERAQNGDLLQQNPAIEEQGAPIAPALAPEEAPVEALPVDAAAPATEFDLAAHAAATSPHNDLPEPTAAQKEAGNYKLGKATLQGLSLSIENPAGSTRKGVDKDGTPWETTMAHHYGYLRGTEGADKDHIDAFIGPNHDSNTVFVIDQVDPTSRKFDEHKVMLGFDSAMAAQAAYKANYADNWRGGDHITAVSMDDFKAWLASGKTKQPFVRSLPRGRVESMEEAEARFHLRGNAPEKVASLMGGEATWRSMFPGTYGDAEAPAAPATPAEAATAAAPAFTKQQLMKKTVRDMSDAELLQAREVLADTPRAPKIDKEIAARQLDAAAPAAPAPAVASAASETPATPAAEGMLANATAPEHIVTGVDDRELGQIVAEFNDAQADMMDGDHPVSNVFQPPAKGDVVRLQDKSKAKLWNPKEVKVYNQQLAERDELSAASAAVPADLTAAIDAFEAVYLPHVAKLKQEADAEIGTWKEHARAQGIDPKIRAENGRKIVLSLFDLSGEWSKPWEEAGYQVYRFDIQDDPEVGDVNNFSTDFFGDWFGDFDGLDVYAILAATPCTDFASSGARHFAAKDADGRTVASVKLVHQTLRTIEYFKPAVWGLENPVGRIESLGGLPPWRLAFDPNHLGDSYTKKTLIWGRFNADLPVAPVEPTEGSKMHRLYGGKSMATKNARSVTPEGFSYGFFMANNAIDHPVMAIANKYDRLDRAAIAEALAAGVTENQINEAVEDFYYMDLDDEAANAAVRELASEAGAPDPAPTKPRKTKASEPTAPAGPVLRPAPDIADLKTYTAKEAKAEWDGASAGRRGLYLGRIEQRETGLADKAWDDMTAAERKMIAHALNEDFYAPMWYVNTKGQQINRSAMPAAPEKSAEQLADEAAAQRWEAMAPSERHGVLLRNGIGKDADQGKFSGWNVLARALRERITASWAADVAQADAKRAQLRAQLMDVAERLGVTVDTTQGGFHATGTMVSIPAEDAQVEGATSPEHVFAHELGHAVMAKRQISFSGFPKKEMLKYITNYDALVAASKAYRPDVHQHAEQKIRRHAMKPNEIIADAIGAVLLGEQGIELLAPMMEKMGITRADLGLAPIAAAPAPAGQFAGNKIFTAEAAARARAVLKSKLGQLNSGIDPEMMQAGIMLAGAHIEAGARSFIAFSKAMIEDIGADIKPYLRSFYEGVRHYPGINGEGMTDGAEIDAMVADPAPPSAAMAAVIGTSPKTSRKTKAAPGNAALRLDYGVEHIDGYAETAEFPVDGNGDYPAGGVKGAFMGDAKRYLNDVAGVLVARGFTTVTGFNGKARKAVSTNEAGPAVAGDVNLAMFNEEAGYGIYVNVGASALRGIVPSSRSGIAVMMRVTDKDAPFGGHENLWMDPGLSARDLAEAIERAIGKFAPQENSTTLAVQPTTEQDDGHSDTGRAGPQALGDVAAQQDGAAGAGRPAARGDAGGSESGAGGNSRSGAEPALQGARGGRGGNAQPHPADAGTAAGGRLGSKRAGRDGSRVSGPDARDSVTPAVAPAAPNVPARNFRITDDVRLGEGSELVKFNDNLAAIRTLKAIESAGRRATPAEQAILARYVGWGGLANAFPSPETGEFKDAWSKRGPELAELLSPKEYALARRSTLDSHYTSKTVVDAMWQAAQQLGYQGGLALESSMGAGGFIGLMPASLAERTKFVGVEYDSLTARIASLLYPQETVLNAGFQSVPLPDGAFDLAIGNPPFGEQSLRFQFKPELNGHSIHNQFFVASIDAVKPGGLQVQVVSRYLLDKQDKSSRVMLAKRAKLLGAIRLPDTAFKENARTSVVTDIVFLQRLSAEEQATMEQAFAAQAQKPSKDREAEFERQALAAQIPDWVNTTTVADPLGGDPITVNRYFASHPQMVLGSLERSGKMAFKNDVTVRPAPDQDLAADLARAVAQLPAGAMVQSASAIDEAIARHESMSDALRIALAGHENGTIRLTEDGVLQQVSERETPEGGYELAMRTLTPTSPWSDQLYQDRNGNWYTVAPVLGEDGKPVKQVKDGKPTKLNVYERKVFANEADIPESMRLGATRHARLKELVQLRDLLKEQLSMEADNVQEAAIEANRTALSQAYQAFIKTHGFINEPANSALVSNMPDGALVQALEFGYRPAISAARAARAGEKARPSSATPAPILSKRVIVPYSAPTAAATTADALAITLAESGRVDLERIAALLGKSAADIVAEQQAEERPLMFKDPESGQWQTRSDYLSGQVKRKLTAARDAGLRQNVVALEAVQPEPWGAESVTALLGSTWIPTAVYADFVQHITGNPAAVTFSAVTNSFHVMAPNTTRANEEEWASTGYTAAGLIADLLNSSAIKVMHTDEHGNAKVNQELTALANLKGRAIVSEFNDWVYKDANRRNELVGVFNDKFNTRVNRQHDGSHLVLPGKVPDAVIAMRRHQKNAIWRGISERFMLIDHTVGAGKTFTAIARAMERRRMGLSRKPAIVVPNHMVEQFASDVYRLYPGAKVLAAGKRDFEKSRRRQLFAKIATGDFDIVIIPHSSFGFIGIAPETEERYLQAELDQAQQAVIDAQEEAEANGHTDFRKPFGVKEAERLVDRITARMERVRGDKGKDRLITFEQMGIDDLTVDEFHEFKNLFYSSRLTNVKGMGNKTGSQKAFDMYNKIRVLRDSPTGSVTAMTGTPISNSAVEMYTMMRYLAADDLKELGLEHFDAWRAQFVSADAGWEPTETGRLAEVTRLGRTWSNMRSLMDLYYSFTDSVDNDDIKAAYAEDNDGAAFPIPRVKGGDRQSVVIEPTKAQLQILGEVLEGFDALPSIKDPQERNKARLRLMDRARKVSLDVRAAEPSFQSDEKGGKLDVLADNVKRIYDQWHTDRGTQLVFLDRSVPKAQGDDAVLKEYDALVATQRRAYEEGDEAGQRRADESLERFDPNEMASLRAAQAGGWNAYQQIKDNLVARGIPADQIRFIQEANTDAQKKAMFDAVNDGTVRVLIGSTPRMGAGTNVQQRLVAIHHADVTWKPSDIEQREGRGIRQGNSLLAKYGMDRFEIEILAYATERTIDAKMWALNSSKLRTINGIRKYDGAFSMEFEDEESVSMAELAALASGDPLLLERVKLMSDIDKLGLLKRQHARREWGITSQIEDAESTIARAPARIEAQRADIAAMRAAQAELENEVKTRSVTVEGKSYSDPSAARAAVHAAVKDQQGGNEKAKVSISVGGRRLASLDGAFGAVGAALGDVQPFSLTDTDGERFAARTDAARMLAELANEHGADLAEGQQTSVKAGTFMGLPLELTMTHTSHGGRYATLALLRADGSTLAAGSTNMRTDAQYTTSFVRSALGELEQSLDIDTQLHELAKQERRLSAAHATLPELLAKRGTGFAQQGELDEKSVRLEEVIKLLSTGEARKSVAVRVAMNPLLQANGTYRRQDPVRSLEFSRTADYFRDDGEVFSPAEVALEEGDAGKEVPRRVVGFDLAAALRDTHALNGQLAAEGMAPVRFLGNAPSAHHALARQVGEVLGIKVHYVSSNGEFEGVASNGVAYLTDGMRNPALAIAGHEVLHALEQSNPVAGAQLRTQIRAYLKEGVVKQRQVREHIASGFKDVSEHTAEGEVLADINGAMWLDAQFWSDLAAADRSLFRTVAYKFMELAAKAIGLLRSSRFDVAQLVTDVAAVRAIMVATWAQQAQRGGKKGDHTSPATFSRGAGDLAASLAAAKDADRQFAAAELQYGGRAAYDAIKAAGATQLSYPQWVITKTPNFKKFYGDWEATDGSTAGNRSIHSGLPQSGDAGGLHGGADAAAGSTPAFPGQSGPVRATGSVAADGAREPVIYYHGSRSEIDAFDLNHPDRKDNGWLGTGVYATSDNWLAESYASLKQGDQGPNVMPVFVAVKNPFIATLQLKNRLRLASREKINEFTADLAARGYDGVALDYPDGSQELVAFNPAAVKSALGNNGAFDAGNADLRFSRANLGETLANAANTINDVRLPAGYLVGDLFNQSGKISWWHKTIGTMENLAKRQPAFRPVYEAVQSFLGDVSRYGVLAADAAPTLLPKLENIADIIGKQRKKPLTAADTKAIGAPIFEGTLIWARDAHGKPVKVAELEAQADQLSTLQKAQILIAKGVIDDQMHKAWQNNSQDFYDTVINSKFAKSQLAAGVVWSDAELRGMFSLNDAQVALYREFRAALDKSLTNLTISEMIKLGGKDATGMLDQAIAAPDLAAAAELLRDHFVELARMSPEKADMHLDTAKQIMDLGDKGIDLMDRGYAPLSRFGKYTVYVQEGGEQVYFSMFETQYEASKMARQMRAEHPQADVSHGTVSEDAYKLFAGVSPETIELFGSMVGLDSQADAASTEVYQAYLKLAKNNRSAMKRMIQRKGIAGFSEDAGRVLAGFIYSNARLTAGNAHLGEIDEAITAIPKQQGELTDAAMQLRESIRNPDNGGTKLGGLMFAQFLGGSVASAMVNLTQPLTMTLPYLSQFGGLAKAAQQLTAAVRDAAKGSTGEAHLDQALQWAADEGIVAPQEIHYLQAQAAGKGALRSGDGTRAGNARAQLNNAMSKVQLGWGKMFAMAELANRRVTFIAAYRTAVDQGIANPAKFAEQAVSQTQGTYNSGNRPRWARGAIGGLLMTFKQYSIGYLELLTRMATAGEKGSKERAAGQRAALYMIAVLFLMAGADGLPFEQDIEDAIDGALQRLGYNFSTKRAKQEFLTDVLGEGGADFALKGISSMPGMPIDVAGRFGMGNLIPGTGLLTKKASYTQDLGELAGPIGDIAGAALDLSPAAVRNAIKGVDMLATGAYNDARGYKVNDVTPTEGVMKIIGFQPNSTANIQDAKGQALNMIAQNRMRSTEIQEHWAQGIASGDPAVVQQARAWRDDWNAKNPETPIRVNMPAIYKRVRSMRQDAINRTQKTAPAALKASVRGELQEVRAI